MTSPFPRPDSVKGIYQWEVYPYKRFQILGENLDSIYKNLISKKVLALQDQKNLLPKFGYYRSFWVEAKVDRVTTESDFDNPERFAYLYPNLEEKFREYQSIVSIFKSLSDKFYPTYAALFFKQL
ncbi:hypothetical protein ACVWYN_000481 [Pedobacter sp. UYP24]